MKNQKTNGNKKATPKVNSKKATTKTQVVEKPKQPKKTISALVLNEFRNNPTIKSNSMIEIVKKSFPESKFNVYHYCWYRYQIKKGRYNKLFNASQIEKIFAK